MRPSHGLGILLSALAVLPLVHSLGYAQAESVPPSPVQVQTDPCKEDILKASKYSLSYDHVNLYRQMEGQFRPQGPNDVRVDQRHCPFPELHKNLQLSFQKVAVDYVAYNMGNCHSFEDFDFADAVLAAGRLSNPKLDILKIAIGLAGQMGHDGSEYGYYDKYKKRYCTNFSQWVNMRVDGKDLYTTIKKVERKTPPVPAALPVDPNKKLLQDKNDECNHNRQCFQSLCRGDSESRSKDCMTCSELKDWVVTTIENLRNKGLAWTCDYSKEP